MNKIKELRTGAGLTQSALAKIMNVRQTTVSMWEKQINTPDIDTALKLASYFGVPVDYLLGKDVVDNNNDDELNEYLDQLRTRPEMRMIFSLTSSATKEDVEKLVKMAEVMFGKN